MISNLGQEISNCVIIQTNTNVKKHSGDQTDRKKYALKRKRILTILIKRLLCDVEM